MQKKRIGLASVLALGLSIASCAAMAADVERIGVVTDISGPLADVEGPGSVEAVKIAVEEFGGTVLGRKIEVLSADHQNKPDIGLSIARNWIDNSGVNLVLDLGNSAVAIAVQNLVKEKGKLSIATGAASAELSNKYCTPNSFQWGYDLYQYAKAAASELVKAGGDTWFFITPDYAYGHALEADTRKAVEAAGGKVLGGVKHPMNTMDFSSYLLQAQASGAKMIALANAIADLQNSMKQGVEFKIFSDAQKPVPLGMVLVDVHAMGLDFAQKSVLSTVFYWDENERTRRFAAKFFARMGKPPTEAHAMNYSATLHYLKSIVAANSFETSKVIEAMRATPVNDDVTSNARIREDGRLMRDVLLVQVKTPAESTKEWDYYKVMRKIPGADAFRPAAESVCPLLKKS